jgi:hypothetical protein
MRAVTCGRKLKGGEALRARRPLLVGELPAALGLHDRGALIQMGLMEDGVHAVVPVLDDLDER